ncbi:hypothetical protein F6W69_10465 [Microbacterium oxydans]|uniref:hypothetical protein n=1 Tax=Microbacterium oxydans TaxID=82380 RepID=UPI00114518F7|nr:hypothetical protein [Microbacterium oxydans]KAB1891014.1 hypothetical protein F6W69_10465 [Microbacterium oxydans]GED39133.1 hypothetical protein MOX01_22750 [Microbacterium oxydans]
MNDTLPLWFAIGGAVFALFGWLVLEFRASARYWDEHDAADPVVVTGSGRRRDSRPYACKSVEVQ